MAVISSGLVMVIANIVNIVATALQMAEQTAGAAGDLNAAPTKRLLTQLETLLNKYERGQVRSTAPVQQVLNKNRALLEQLNVDVNHYNNIINGYSKASVANNLARKYNHINTNQIKNELQKAEDYVHTQEQRRAENQNALAKQEVEKRFANQWSTRDVKGDLYETSKITQK